ncbi:MAG: ATP-binding protein, partial [Gammaproteobacteria bacterium]
PEDVTMMLAVASGKGGTGKTMVATNLALSVPGAQYIDCDVEEPDGHIFLHPEIRERRAVTVPLPQIHEDACTLCGDCAEACEFNALALSSKRVLVFADLCHGCGVCSYVCPEKGAISETQRRIGDVAIGVAPNGNGAGMAFAEGILDVGQPTAVPVIRAVKQTADTASAVILDAPPGTACPMVATVRDADYCLLVTEPTPFGLSDLRLAVEVIRQLEIPCGVVLNRCDTGDQAVAEYCREEAIPILMQVPFSRDLAIAYSRGVPWVKEAPEYAEQFRALFQAIVAEARL